MRVLKRVNEADMKNDSKKGGVIRFSLDDVLGELQESRGVPKYSDERYNIFLKDASITVYDRATQHKLTCSAHIHLYAADARQCLEDLKGKFHCTMSGKAEAEVRPFVGDGVTLVCNHYDFIGQSEVEVSNEVILDVAKVTLDFKDPEVLEYI